MSIYMHKEQRRKRRGGHGERHVPREMACGRRTDEAVKQARVFSRRRARGSGMRLHGKTTLLESAGTLCSEQPHQKEASQQIILRTRVTESHKSSQVSSISTKATLPPVGVYRADLQGK